MTDQQLTTHAECVEAADRVRETAMAYNAAVTAADEVNVVVKARVTDGNMGGLVVLEELTLEIRL